MERNRTIDFLRFVFSLMVIAVHTDFLIDISTPIYYMFTLGIARIAVPFFFIVSGYFFRQSQLNGKSRKQYLLKLVKYYFIFITVDLLAIGYFYYNEYTSIAQFIRKYLVCGISGSYWYFPSLIISMLILIPVFRKGYTRTAIFVGLVLYLVSMTHDSYSFLFENTLIYRITDLHTRFFFMPQAGLAESILFLSLGAIICENSKNIREISTRYHNVLEVLLVVLTLCLCLEAYITMSLKAFDGNCYLTLLFLPAVLFIWALTSDPVKMNTALIGKMSLFIYLVHPVFKSLVNLTQINSVIKTIFVTAITLPISFLLVKITDASRRISKFTK